MKATPATATAMARFSNATMISRLSFEAALVRMPGPSTRVPRAPRVETGATVAMVYRTPTRIATFLSENTRLPYVGADGRS